METRLFYVDDSGHYSTGWVVYGWVEVLLSDWKLALGDWLRFRKEIYGSPGIPASYELHSSPFVNGRGNPTGREAWDRRKAFRGPIIERALDAINGCSLLNVGSAQRHIRANDASYSQHQAEVYHELISLWDQQAQLASERYVVIMDGDGTASSYHGAHRALDIESRHVIEDPLLSPSHRSQWIQMADVIAYSAYMNAAEISEKDFAWDWYSRVAESDTNHGPLEL